MEKAIVNKTHCMKRSTTATPRSIGICFSCGIRKQKGIDVMAWDTKARVDRALMLYKLGMIDTILCTGGIFQKGQTKAASVVMAEYLAEQGVPKEALLAETTSLDTIENIKFGLALLKKEGYFADITSTEDVRLVLISETHHLRRIEITTHAYLEKLGLNDLVPLLFEPVLYSISEQTFHTEEATLHLTELDPYGEGPLFRETREARSQTKPKKRA